MFVGSAPLGCNANPLTGYILASFGTFIGPQKNMKIRLFEAMLKPKLDSMHEVAPPYLPPLPPPPRPPPTRPYPPLHPPPTPPYTPPYPPLHPPLHPPLPPPPPPTPPPLPSTRFAQRGGQPPHPP